MAMPAPMRLRLDQPTREAVARHYEWTSNAIERTNCQMVLLADEGRGSMEIAWLVRRGREQVRTVLHRFHAEGLAGLVPRKRTGRPREVTPAWLAELERVIERDPHTVGVDSAVWTTRLLADYLAEVTGHRAGIEVVRVHLHRLGYVCKRPTWSLKRKSTEQAGWVKNRLRVEALLAAAALPEPPPLDELMPDPLLQDELPEDLPWLLRLLPRADVYLQDEVEVALHPTLTRVWCRKGRRGQRLVEAPGNNSKEYGFGLVDWRDGWFDWRRAPKRSAPPLCAQLRRAVERSQARGRIALVLLDNLGTHTPAGSLQVRALLEELRGQLMLVYTPTYDPEANRIEWLWRSLRRAVTHTHTRESLPPLLEDADRWAHTISPTDILQQIGSPFADADPIDDQELTRAA
jgi:putative transposase